ncbi:hypothetical protein F5B19DRAFT_494739 [Rostrohypoxylon terebratum]|nr:hypothetical protein F5B19DRAFT_494739 [Rostrohypoxylon terebratum]
MSFATSNLNFSGMNAVPFIQVMEWFAEVLNLPGRPCLPPGFFVHLIADPHEEAREVWILHSIREDSTIEEVKDRVKELLNVNLNGWKLMHGGHELEDERRLSYYNIQRGLYICLIRLGDVYLGLRSGLEIGPGGLISETLHEDRFPNRWESEALGKVVVRVVDFNAFKDLTKIDPLSLEPDKISKTFPTRNKRYNDPSVESANVKSIAQLEEENQKSTLITGFEPGSTSITASSIGARRPKKR